MRVPTITSKNLSSLRATPLLTGTLSAVATRPGVPFVVAGCSAGVMLLKREDLSPYDVIETPRPVKAVDVDPSGAHLAIAEDKTIGYNQPRVSVISIADRETLFTLSHEHTVENVFFSADGRQVITGGYGSHVLSMAGPQTWEGVGSNTATMSRDGVWMAANTDKTTVQLVDRRDPRQVTTLSDHRHPITCLAFSPGGRWLAVGGWTELTIWDVAKRKVCAHQAYKTLRFSHVEFSPEGAFLAAGDDSGKAHIWRAPNDDRWEEAAVFKCGEGAVLGPRFLDEQMLVAGSYGARNLFKADVKGVVLCRAARGSWNSHVDAKHAWFSTTGTLLVRTKEEKVFEVEPDTGAVRWIPGSGDAAWDNGWTSPDHRFTAETAHDGGFARCMGDSYEINNSVIIRSADTEQEVARHRHTGRVSGISFLADNRHIATAAEFGGVDVWDFRTGELRIALPLSEGTYASPLRASPVADRLAACLVRPGGAWTEKRPIRIWDLDSESSHDLAGHVGPVNALAFSPDGMLVATCSDDGTVLIWSLGRTPLRKKPYQLCQDGGSVRRTAFSADGTLLLALTFTGALKLWRVGCAERGRRASA